MATKRSAAVVVAGLTLAVYTQGTHAQVFDGPPQGITPGGGTQTPPPVQIRQVASWGGPVNCFVRDGAHGYVGSGERLVVINMADYTEVAVVRLGSAVMDIALRDGFLYVVTDGIGDESTPGNHLGLSCAHVIDVRQPSQPVHVWKNPHEWPLSRNLYQMREIDLYENAHCAIAIVRNYNNLELHAIEISDPFNPIAMAEDGIWYLDSGTGTFIFPKEIAIQGDLMFVAMHPKDELIPSLFIYDLSDLDPGDLPMTPPLVGSLAFSDANDLKLMHVDVDGDTAYVVVDGLNWNEDRQVVYAVDVSTPAAPAILGEYDQFYYPNSAHIDVAASGGLVYVTDPTVHPTLWMLDVSRGLVVLDMLTDPQNPAVVGEFKGRAGTFAGSVIDGSTLYLFDHAEGLAAYDASNPADLVRLGNYHSPAALQQIAKQGDYLYVVDVWNGFSILDVSDPANPTLVGVHQSIPDGIRNWGIDVEGDYAYFAAGAGGGLEVVDVADPSNPVLHAAMREPPYGSFEFRGYGTHMGGVELVGDTVYFGAKVGGPGWTSRRVFNVDAVSLLPIDPDGYSATTAQIIYSFEVDPDRPFLFGTGASNANQGGGLLAVDISDPENLSWAEMGGIPQAFAASLSDAQPNLLAAVDGNPHYDGGGLYMLDITDVDAPVQLGVVPLYKPGAVDTHQLGTITIAYSNDLAGDQLQRVFMFDNASPLSPRILASALLPGRAGAAHGTHEGPTGDLLAEGRAIYVTTGRDGEDPAQRSTTPGLAIFEVLGGGTRSRADRNGDGLVDMRDLIAFLHDVERGRRSADLNGDGRTDSRDVVMFIEHLALSR